MDLQSLIKTDLNLLVTLFVLLEERSVSKAAERLFITQSAVSKALSRLRERFDDPLFHRVGHKLVATPYLESRAGLLRTTLEDVSRLFAPQQFQPETCQATIRVTFPEMIDLVVTPRLLAHLRGVAPGIRISAEHYVEEVLGKLADGVVDFAIGMEYSHYPADFETVHFLDSSPSVMARREHPLAGGAPLYQDMIQYPRIAVRLPDQSLTDFFKRFNDSARSEPEWPAYFETESMLSALSIVRLTDYLLPVPDFVADALLATTDLEKFGFPGYVERPFRYVIVYHRRVLDSPMHLWFAEVLKQLGRDLLIRQEVRQ